MCVCMYARIRIVRMYIHRLSPWVPASSTPPCAPGGGGGQADAEAQRQVPNQAGASHHLVLSRFARGPSGLCTTGEEFVCWWCNCRILGSVGKWKGCLIWKLYCGVTPFPFSEPRLLPQAAGKALPRRQGPVFLNAFWAFLVGTYRGQRGMGEWRRHCWHLALAVASHLARPKTRICLVCAPCALVRVLGGS